VETSTRKDKGRVGWSDYQQAYSLKYGDEARKRQKKIAVMTHDRQRYTIIEASKQGKPPKNR
jgi:hypothetical protein